MVIQRREYQSDGPRQGLFQARDYARGKAFAFLNECGPVILMIDIPDEIVQRAVNDWYEVVRFVR
jgi:hypothetical protein